MVTDEGGGGDVGRYLEQAIAVRSFSQREAGQADQGVKDRIPVVIGDAPVQYRSRPAAVGGICLIFRHWFPLGTPGPCRRRGRGGWGDLLIRFQWLGNAGDRTTGDGRFC